MRKLTKSFDRVAARAAGALESFYTTRQELTDANEELVHLRYEANEEIQRAWKLSSAITNSIKVNEKVIRNIDSLLGEE